MDLQRDENVFAPKQVGKIPSQDSSDIIGRGAFVKGDLITTGNIRIEGKVLGNIKTTQKVVVGESAYIEGNLHAQNGEIAGELKGSVKITGLLILKPSAVIHGNILTDKLVIEAGAFFRGKSKMGSKFTVDLQSQL